MQKSLISLIEPKGPLVRTSWSPEPVCIGDSTSSETDDCQEDKGEEEHLICVPTK